MSLEGIQPQYDPYSNTYTWYIKHPKSIKIAYRKKKILLSYQQGPIKNVNYVKTNSRVYHYMWLTNNTYNNPSRINVIDNEIIELSWHPRSISKHAPIKLLIMPDDIIEIMWQATIFTRHDDVFERCGISKYDKQGNLLYLTSELSSGHVYRLDLISPNTYRVYPYHPKRIKQWALNMRVHEKIIHV